MRYWTVDREAGNRIDCFDTKEKAMEAIERYEQEDREDGIYTPNFYDVEEAVGISDTYLNIMGYESSSRCPKCGSYNCADHDTPYWSECLDCGFESMASDDSNKAIEYWVNGYADIEDKAKHVGIDGMDHEELLDLWWHENGFCACVDMGMSEEEIDDYWNSNREALVEECGMMWAALGY